MTGKTKTDFESGSARYVTYLNVFNYPAVRPEEAGFVNIAAGERQHQLMRGDICFTGSSESYAECGMSSVVTTEPTEPLYLNSFCIGYSLHDPTIMNPHFAKHLFRSTPIRTQIIKTANGVTRFNVSKKRLARLSIPVPDLETQRRIADVLDSFSELAESLSSGLPAELAARRQQYDYYRDRLFRCDPRAA